MRVCASSILLVVTVDGVSVFAFVVCVTWWDAAVLELQVASMLAFEGDATPFTSLTVEYIADLLHKLGFQKSGNEIMYNGHTGRKMEAQIFLGPTYYQVRGAWAAVRCAVCGVRCAVCGVLCVVSICWS